MEKSQAQAERHSNRAGAPRASPAFCYFFLFIHRLQAQAYSRGLRALRGSPAQRYFFLFIHRLQAQAHSNRVGPPRVSRPFFFIFLIR